MSPEQLKETADSNLETTKQNNLTIFSYDGIEFAREFKGVITVSRASVPKEKLPQHLRRLTSIVSYLEQQEQGTIESGGLGNSGAIESDKKFLSIYDFEPIFTDFKCPGCGGLIKRFSLEFYREYYRQCGLLQRTVSVFRCYNFFCKYNSNSFKNIYYGQHKTEGVILIGIKKCGCVENLNKRIPILELECNKHHTKRTINDGDSFREEQLDITTLVRSS